MARSTEIYEHLQLLKSRPGWAALPVEKQLAVEEKYKNLHAQALGEERGIISPPEAVDPMQLKLKQDPAPVAPAKLDFGALREKLSSMPSQREINSQVIEPGIQAPKAEPIPAWNEHPVDFTGALIGEGYKSARRIPAKAGATMLQMGGYLSNLTGFNETAKDMYDASTLTDEDAQRKFPSAIKPIEKFNGEGGLVDTLSSPVQKLLPYMVSSGGEMVGTMLPTMGVAPFAGRLFGRALAGLTTTEGAIAKSAADKIAKSIALSEKEIEVMDKIRLGTQKAGMLGGFGASTAMEGGSIMSDFQNDTGQVPSTTDAAKTLPFAALAGALEFMFGGESGAVRSVLDQGAHRAGKAATREALKDLEKSLPRKVLTNTAGEMLTEGPQTGIEEVSKEYLKTKDLGKALENTANLDTLAKMTGAALSATLGPGVMATIQHHGDRKTAKELRRTVQTELSPSAKLLQTMKDPSAPQEAKDKAFMEFSELPTQEKALAEEEFSANQPPPPAAPSIQPPSEQTIIPPGPVPEKSGENTFGENLAQKLAENIPPGQEATLPVEPASVTPIVPEIQAPTLPVTEMQNRDRTRTESVRQMETLPIIRIINGFQPVGHSIPGRP